MRIGTPLSKQPPRPAARWDGPQALSVALLGLGSLALLFATWALPQPLVLPALSILLIAAAAATALVALRQPQEPSRERVTYWDVSGALTFIGICAALLSDSAQVLPLLETPRTD